VTGVWYSFTSSLYLKELFVEKSGVNVGSTGNTMKCLNFFCM